MTTIRRDVRSAEVTTGRVLLVKNDNAVRAGLARSLTERGFAVRGEADGRSALRALAQEPFDVLLSDLVLQGMDGSTMVAKAKKARPEIAVLVLTKERSNENSIVADELGALFCLVEPKLDILIRALSSVMERHVQEVTKAAATTLGFTHWVETVATAAAKSQFSRVMDRAVLEGPVRITKNHKPRAVLLSIDRYEELVQSEKSPLDDLSSEFDALLARMQQTDAVAAATSLFGATPEELGQTALDGAGDIE